MPKTKVCIKWQHKTHLLSFILLRYSLVEFSVLFNSDIQDSAFTFISKISHPPVRAKVLWSADVYWFLHFVLPHTHLHIHTSTPASDRQRAFASHPIENNFIILLPIPFSGRIYKVRALNSARTHTPTQTRFSKDRYTMNAAQIPRNFRLDSTYVCRVWLCANAFILLCASSQLRVVPFYSCF